MQAIILDPPQMYAALDNVAYVKTHLHKSKVLLLALMAGFFIAAGSQGFIAVTATAPVYTAPIPAPTAVPLPPAATPSAPNATTAVPATPTPGTYKAPSPTTPMLVLGAIVFAFGLIAIVHCGAELFTGNALLIMAVLQGHVPLRAVVLEWLMVWCGNFCGTAIFSIIIYGSGVNGYYTEPNNSGHRVCAIATSKANENIWEMFFRGVLANFCVCSAVLLAVSSKSSIGKQFGITWPLVLFIICGYDHSIANMYYFSEATLLSCHVKNHGYYWLNLLLSSLGNICGGAILSGVYWFAYLRENPNPNDASPKIAPYAAKP